MHSQEPEGRASDPNETASARRRPAPEPRVAGTGYGAIGIAAVAAAVRYQGSGGNAAPPAGTARHRS